YTGYDVSYLLDMIRNQKNYYLSFKIPKNSDSKKYRKINSPTTDLKIIQRWILTNILEKNEVSPYAKAYKKHTSLNDNVKFHRRQEVVLKIDFEDFFGSLTIKYVVCFFKKIGYSKNVAFMLARLCTLNDSLPQGAVTSPMLSNLLLNNFDEKVFEFCRTKSLRFSRYADDLTFSGRKSDLDKNQILEYVKKCASDLKLRINPSKTKLLYSNSRQVITGIVVNDKLQVSAKKRKKIRSEIYYIKKYGLSDHLVKSNCFTYVDSDVEEMYLRSLLGKIGHALMINNKDTELRGYYNYIIELLTIIKVSKE
ncbi:reverse transcriptase family protein, partial [Erysipelothrix rhusiopathiae]|nr:reverse transcriptase family protein [Erysipelothrix rhusiopathiae]